MLKKRHYSRKLALQALYSDEFRCRNNQERDEDYKLEVLEQESEEDVKAYALYLLNGVEENKAKIDETISKYSLNRQINDIDIVDLSILRLSVFSLLFDDSLHPSIVIDEAVKLSQEFSSSKNYKFINGVLDAFVKREFSDTAKKQN